MTTEPAAGKSDEGRDPYRDSTISGYEVKTLDPAIAEFLIQKGWKRVPGYRLLNNQFHLFHRGQIWELALLGGTDIDRPSQENIEDRPGRLFSLGCAILWLAVRSMIKQATKRFRRVLWGSKPDAPQ
jgi:hypothetical protein